MPAAAMTMKHKDVEKVELSSYMNFLYEQGVTTADLGEITEIIENVSADTDKAALNIQDLLGKEIATNLENSRVKFE